MGKLSTTSVKPYYTKCLTNTTLPAPRKTCPLYSAGYPREASEEVRLKRRPLVIRQCLASRKVEHFLLQAAISPPQRLSRPVRDHKDTHPSEQHRLKVALGVSGRLAHAHVKNVIHCDISCRNLFLFPNWCAKVGVCITL
ncbi:hypothetical protein B0O99DRAFT_628284 [Bisporella sp. PMI_857]|nr:hypothetical protein B0O99DRAFT_628284 [Bisporella sp. PMI_857]